MLKAILLQNLERTAKLLLLLHLVQMTRCEDPDLCCFSCCSDQHNCPKELSMYREPATTNSPDGKSMYMGLGLGCYLTARRLASDLTTARGRWEVD